MLKFVSERRPGPLPPDDRQIDHVQELSYKGLSRRAIAAEVGIDAWLLDRWAEQCAEIRDALSVSDAINRQSICEPGSGS